MYDSWYIFPCKKYAKEPNGKLKKKGGVKCLKLDKIIFHVCDLNFFLGGGAYVFALLFLFNRPQRIFRPKFKAGDFLIIK